MYKIMLADDESIVIEALKFIISDTFGDECEVAYAKTGRGVVELAQEFRPDIAIMDIQMPGINGIDAMKEIQSFNPSIIFIVMSAYDKFDYAKQAIDLGVLDYLTKPVERDKIEAVLKKAMAINDKRKEKRSNDLRIKEKLEIVVPFMESGLIYSLLFGENDIVTVNKYRELLSIPEESAYCMVLEAGERENERVSNEVGNGVRLDDKYDVIREAIKSTVNCIVGPIMSNRIICIVPFNGEEIRFAERSVLIENIRKKLHELREAFDIELRVGVGRLKSWRAQGESYREALQALKISVGSVSHADDLEVGPRWENDYPIELEREIFANVAAGLVTETGHSTREFWNWMVGAHSDDEGDIRIKVIDFILRAEYDSYQKGGGMYRFDSRKDYLETAYRSSLTDLENWFVQKMSDAARRVNLLKEDSLKSPIVKAVEYIREHFRSDISLDDVARMVDVTPYYFSKLFKAEEGVNFIDYLTALRIEEARKMLSGDEFAVKEVGARVGYQDPNYFSRIFKKNTGYTPTEYKEKCNEKNK
ncbi:MAG: response regulator [Lachnospiraceae bacterium]|nr:response regulator [Lachnospiraceae bacterium]